jgi:hypothetical protein
MSRRAEKSQERRRLPRYSLSSRNGLLVVAEGFVKRSTVLELERGPGSILPIWDAAVPPPSAV